MRVLSTAACAALALSLAGPAAHAAIPLDDALRAKPVLSNLLGSEHRLSDAIEQLALPSNDADALEALVLDEKIAAGALFSQALSLVDDTGVINSEGLAAYNQAVTELGAAQSQRLEALLGDDRYQAFLTWAEPLWQGDARRYGNQKTTETTVSYEVFCTQYNAYTTYEVAVPDKYVKFAAQGTAYNPGYPADLNYQVTLDRGAAPYTVRVYEVGPWNVDDNYWNAANDPERPRRLFTDLPKGMPEAQAAYYDGYNGGKDQYDRTVLNPGGCDLSIQVADDIGLAYLENDWIQVTYLWESGGSTPSGCQGMVGLDDGSRPSGAFPALLMVGGMALFRRRRR